MNKLNHKDVLVRALKTALAAAITTLVATHLSYNRQGLVAIGSAVVTALLNYTIQLLNA